MDQLGTYVFSNMTPQYAKFNRYHISNLEAIINKWAEKDTIYIITENIYDYNADSIPDKPRELKAKRMIPEDPKFKPQVIIPSHNFKIVYKKVNCKWNSLTFLLENKIYPKASVMSYKTVHENGVSDIKTIEKLTGVTFFSKVFIESPSITDWNK